MSEVSEAPKRRRSPEEKARDEKMARAKAEAMARHPEATECVFSAWGPELFITVWQDGKCVGHYEYLEDE